MSRFCKFGKLHVTKGNVQQIISLISFLYVNSLHCLNDYFCLDLQN